MHKKMPCFILQENFWPNQIQLEYEWKICVIH